MRRIVRWFAAFVIVAALAFGLSWVVFMPTADERGTWRAQAGGMVIKLTSLRADVYRETSISCFQQLTFPAHLKIVELLEGVQVSILDGRLNLKIDGQVEPVVLDRIDALPKNCSKSDPQSATPRQTFNVLWTAMDEHYAFFNLYGVDWQARRALAPAVDAQMSDQDLYTLLQQTLAGLDDGHVQLVAGGLGFFSPAKPPDWFKQAGLDRAQLTQIARDNIGSTLTAVDGTLIEYTLRDDRIGYVLICGMDVQTGIGQLEEPTVANAFAAVAEALKDAKAIIIDIRYNPGGSDSISLGIASHFAAQTTPAFSKSSRIGEGQGPSFTAVLNPYDQTPLSQPVILLTTGLTGSAAEIFTITMGELPQVVSMGEATSGGLSDILDFDLPNGWSVGLSDQTYLTMDGRLFEAVGVPPDMPVAVDAAALMRGEDPLLAAAIAHAQGL